MSIEINHVTKDYGNGCGVFDISFNIDSIGVYGLLGVNGAGKSTLMGIMSGYLSFNGCGTNIIAPNGEGELVPQQPKKI